MKIASRPYPVYKNSALPWLGNIPEHWSLLPNRALMRRRKVLVGESHANYELLSLTKTGVVVRDVESGKGKFSADMGTSQQVRKGDLIFCLFDVPETPRTVGLSNHDGMITGAYTVFECSDSMLSAFVDRFYRAMDDRKLLSPLYSGLRNTIPPTRFLGTKSPVPPSNEQRAIVRFLDYVDRRVNRLIRAKRRLVALLNEQKQAIILRAVTRGLDPNVRLKPSGVDWLGDVPQHWDLLRAKYLYREVDERSSTGEEESLSVSHISGVVPRSSKKITMFMAESYAGHKLCSPGDLVINTMWAWMGALGVSTRHGIVSPAYGVYRSSKSEGSEPGYMDAILRTRIYVAEFVRRSTGIRSSRLRLYPEKFLEIPIVQPPIDEQHRIVEYVVRETGALAVAIEQSNREIELMREYRTRLIADVVTGKLDVREAAAKLPDEADEPEMLDESDVDGIDEESEGGEAMEADD